MIVDESLARIYLVIDFAHLSLDYRIIDYTPTLYYHNLATSHTALKTTRESIRFLFGGGKLLVEQMHCREPRSSSTGFNFPLSNMRK